VQLDRPCRHGHSLSFSDCVAADVGMHAVSLFATEEKQT
jgi:hypothetical protein